MEADSAFAGPAREVVLHAVTGEHAEGAVVHTHRHRDFEHAFGLAQVAVQRFVEADEPAHLVELALRHIPNVFGCLDGG